jgi:ParB family transcriptional regulator, chromosome partitioning protein
MARKDLLKGLLDAPAPPPSESPAPRHSRGAIGAVSQSIADLRGRAMVDVPADLIDTAGIDDRLDEDPDGIAALAASIREHGQQVPVLLRHSPNYEGRFEVVYGRRRVAALKRLGLPVRAMLRDLTDRELIVAQGQENSARRDLSFIEKARFAQAMQKQGFDRAVICQALHIDKTVVSRMLQVVDAVPEKLIRAIGSAPSAGRDRWLALARRLPGQDIRALITAARGADSDTRFKTVFTAAGTPLAMSPAPPVSQPLTGADGRPLGRVRRGRGGVSLDLTGTEGAEFAGWLHARLPELHARWLDQRRDEDPDPNTGGT